MKGSDLQPDVRGSGAVVAALTTVGVLMVVGAFVALVVAGINVADTFPPVGDAARDTGVFRAITAWATPLALLGVAILFGTAIPTALARVRRGMGERRDGLSKLLARPISNH